jgi:hypothetical protein
MNIKCLLRCGTIAFILSTIVGLAQAIDFEVVSWNVESGGDDPNLIAQHSKVSRA